VRKGDNLYSDSAIALDADTGKLKWHFQMVPHDVHDWDSTQVPLRMPIGRQAQKAGLRRIERFHYVLDRELANS
jgi:alcohol dehydrogenase (cytochrome c)